jgi:predicted restriction endonuclease
MTKYIDAEKLASKVKKLNIVTKTYEEQVSFSTALLMVIELIDTLSKEQTDVDLEKEVEEYFQGYWPGMETAEQCNTDLHFTPPSIMRMIEYFFELGQCNARKK